MINEVKNVWYIRRESVEHSIRTSIKCVCNLKAKVDAKVTGRRCVIQSEETGV